MNNNIVNFTINFNGNAYTGVAALDKALGNVIVDATKVQCFMSYNFRYDKNKKQPSY